MATSGNFGTVETTDDLRVTGWQWEESADDASWANVGTILTDISGQTTPTLTVNSATLAQDGTYVRCVATYDAGATVESNSAQLTVTATGGVSPEAQAVIDRMAGLTSPQTDALIAFVDSQVASGNWAKIDEFWCFALNSTDWMTGWKASTATAYQDITYTANGAYQGSPEGDGNNGIIQTGVTPSTATNMVQGNQSLGVYLHSHNASGGWKFSGTQDNTGSWPAISIQHDGSNVVTLVGDASISNPLALASFGGKLHTAREVGGTASHLIDGVEQANTAGATGAIVGSHDIWFCLWNERGNIYDWPAEQTVTSAYCGAGDIDHANLYTHLMTLHTALGVS